MKESQYSVDFHQNRHGQQMYSRITFVLHPLRFTSGPHSTLRNSSRRGTEDSAGPRSTAADPEERDAAPLWHAGQIHIARGDFAQAERALRKVTQCIGSS